MRQWIVANGIVTVMRDEQRGHEQLRFGSAWVSSWGGSSGSRAVRSSRPGFSVPEAAMGSDYLCLSVCRPTVWRLAINITTFCTGHAPRPGLSLTNLNTHFFLPQRFFVQNTFPVIYRCLELRNRCLTTPSLEWRQCIRIK
jgi:hypothetical protein